MSDIDPKLLTRRGKAKAIKVQAEARLRVSRRTADVAYRLRKNGATPEEIAAAREQVALRAKVDYVNHIKGLSLAALLPRSIEVLAELLDDEDPKLRFAAAREVQHRVWGAHKASVDVQVTESPTESLLREVLRRHGGPALPEGPPTIDVTSAPSES